VNNRRVRATTAIDQWPSDIVLRSGYWLGNNDRFCWLLLLLLSRDLNGLLY